MRAAHGDARRLPTGDLRSLRPACQFSPARRRARSRPPRKTGHAASTLQTPRGAFAADFVICATNRESTWILRAGPELQKLRRQHRYPGSDRATSRRRYRAEPAAWPLSLSRRRLRADLERVAGDHAVDRRTSIFFAICVHHELRRVGVIDQCDDHRDPETGAWSDARPVPRVDIERY